MDPSLDFTWFVKVIWKLKIISHYIIWRKQLVWVIQLGYLYTVSFCWSIPELNLLHPALWSVPSSGSAKLVLKARPWQKNPFVASGRTWAPFPCSPIQCDCYYSFVPADKLLLRKGGNSTWVDEYRQVSTVNSCEWWQKVQEIVRHEKCVQIYYKKNKIPLLLGGGNSKKKQAWEKKKDKQPKQEQNSKSLNMIIQADESYH